jgi:plastocyanin
VTSSAFAPRNIIVAPGTVVTWTWQDQLEHNVTFSSGGIQNSGNRTGGQFQTPMPQTAGTYSYSCTIHSFNGTVRVQ